MTLDILVLGGTTEGRQLATRLARDARFRATLSLAGRTAAPLESALPTRVGGFGGAEGLADYIAKNRIGALVVATHPYAARIAGNAATAARMAAIPAIRLLRAQWEWEAGDDWREFPSLPALVDALGTARRRVFVTIGRQEAHEFARAPQHAYLFRSIDPIDPPLKLPAAEFLHARGPFAVDEEMALMRAHRIDILVAKHAGGAATYAKIAAARQLGLPVYLVARPAATDLVEVGTVDAVIEFLAGLQNGCERGV